MPWESSVLRAYADYMGSHTIARQEIGQEFEFNEEFAGPVLWGFLTTCANSVRPHIAGDDVRRWTLQVNEVCGRAEVGPVDLEFVDRLLVLLEEKLFASLRSRVGIAPTSERYWVLRDEYDALLVMSAICQAARWSALGEVLAASVALTPILVLKCVFGLGDADEVVQIARSLRSDGYASFHPNYAEALTVRRGVVLSG